MNTYDRFRLIHLRVRNVADQLCREIWNTHFMFQKLFFRKSCLL